MNLTAEVESALKDLEGESNYLTLCELQKKVTKEEAFAIEFAKQHMRQELIMTLVASRFFPTQAPVVTSEALKIIGELKKKSSSHLKIIK